MEEARRRRQQSESTIHQRADYELAIQVICDGCQVFNEIESRRRSRHIERTIWCIYEWSLWFFLPLSISTLIQYTSRSASLAYILSFAPILVCLMAIEVQAIRNRNFTAMLIFKFIDTHFFMTEFADWTEEEMRNILLDGFEEEAAFQKPRFTEKILDGNLERPSQFDWTANNSITPVKNQGQCGSCWAFATLAAVEAMHSIKRGVKLSLSEQQLIDCDQRSNGCKGGNRPYAMDYVKKNGIQEDKNYPYKAADTFECRTDVNATKYYISSYEILSRDEEQIADWVATRGPVTFGMKVVKPLFHYSSGIFDPDPIMCEEQSMGSHALLIVGYGEENGKPYWNVKNSWGPRWGLNGYLKLARGKNSCGAAEFPVAPILN
ncbi:unnamed protein product [Caenorhabditis bovis]|uniref:Peptidase C1A papain C-terminal domain-containing protein n=1 Tax=Caenorhabditis bovis TaxID=2654633 RepID=A0A8S1EF61_9PELO|nr:unnamed protein product [Caenorhabditis bovis]